MQLPDRYSPTFEPILMHATGRTTALYLGDKNTRQDHIYSSQAERREKWTAEAIKYPNEIGKRILGLRAILEEANQYSPIQLEAAKLCWSGVRDDQTREILAKIMLGNIGIAFEGDVNVMNMVIEHSGMVTNLKSEKGKIDPKLQAKEVIKSVLSGKISIVTAT